MTSWWNDIGYGPSVGAPVGDGLVAVMAVVTSESGGGPDPELGYAPFPREVAPIGRNLARGQISRPLVRPTQPPQHAAAAQAHPTP